MKKQTERKNQVLQYAGLGTQMLVLLGLGVWAGLYLDEKWNCSPLFLIVLPVLALAISLVNVYRQLTRK